MNTKEEIVNDLVAKRWDPDRAGMYADTKIAFDKLVESGDVHLRIESYYDADPEDLMGDLFEPEANPDIPEVELQSEKTSYIQRMDDEGIWGVIGEFKCPYCESWIEADSVWGFVGNDWKESGYDEDIMNTTMEKLNEAMSKTKPFTVDTVLEMMDEISEESSDWGRSSWDTLKSRLQNMKEGK